MSDRECDLLMEVVRLRNEVSELTLKNAEIKQEMVKMAGEFFAELIKAQSFSLLTAGWAQRA